MSICLTYADSSMSLCERENLNVFMYMIKQKNAMPFNTNIAPWSKKYHHLSLFHKWPFSDTQTVSVCQLLWSDFIHQESAAWSETPLTCTLFLKTNKKKQSSHPCRNQLLTNKLTGSMWFHVFSTNWNLWFYWIEHFKQWISLSCVKLDT